MGGVEGSWDSAGRGERLTSGQRAVPHAFWAAVGTNNAAARPMAAASVRVRDAIVVATLVEPELRL